MVAESGPDEPLEGGNSSVGVVRRGSTVRKPWLSTTERTITYIGALNERGIHVPIVHGRDDQGRLVLDFIPGTMAIDVAPPELGLVARVEALVRAIHEASVGLAVMDDRDVLLPSDQPDLICHNELATWNLLIDGDRPARLHRLGRWRTEHAIVGLGLRSHPLRSPVPPPTSQAPRSASGPSCAVMEPTRLFGGITGSDGETRPAMHDLLRRTHEIGREPWATMFVEGHGEHWVGTAQFIHDHEVQWHAALKDSAPTT